MLHIKESEEMLKKLSAVALSMIFIILLVAGCGNTNNKTAVEPTTHEIKTKLPKLNMKKWHYIAKQNIYYQTDVAYCEKPANEFYEKLSVFVPGAYMNAKKNSDGTFTCKLNTKAKLNEYTAADAPIVMPINTPGYSASTAINETEINNNQIITKMLSLYTSQGFVLISSGCRGGNEGAPTGVTDLKAAIRYIRYCDDVIAGDAESIFVFGMSGGGAQAAILGAAGDSELYEPYLKKIGAVQGASDSVAGSMDWCPVTSLNTANAEYEWMMGSSRTGQSKIEKKVSEKLAVAYAEYVNKAGFKDKDGNTLTLEESKDGIYQAGSYYDYLKSVIEKSLNNFLEDTDFADSSAQAFIDTLNTDKKWINYDKSTNTATITSISDFVNTLKIAKGYPVAFDRPEIENSLFGFGDGKGAHFDSILAGILTDLKSKYASDYNSDLEKKDSLGNTMEHRVNMYSPLYFLMENEEGFKTTNVAKFWRIRSGIEQTNTSVTTEVNLALALEQYDGVESVDFETVWAQGHAEAERKGDSAANFIKWVNDCMKK